ncbi:YHS domain-containing protein [Methanosarcina mazei]|nr:YHS domain-containing protein [Methanosarcina mazei]UWJ23459.1 hypothetical protein MSMAT_2202 [Methanosarcina mazei TMA]
MAILLAVVAVVSAAGCFEKAEVAGNETQKASEQVTTAALPTTSVAKSAPSVTPLAKENTNLTSSTVLDVVCKMKIDKRTAEFTSEYKGTTYYFCALSCKEEFDANPEKYISSETTEDETPEASEQVTSVAANNADSTPSSVVDVICGMTIDKGTAEFTSEYKGTTYYFCALSCKEKFDANPEKYISSETTENNSEITENKTQEASEQETSLATKSTNSTSSTVVDVVYKMKIDKRTAEFTSEYKGTTYYFCALSCKKEFDANPEKYLGSEKTENNSVTTEDETQKNCKTTENETAETSEQVTSATTNDMDSTSSSVVDVVCKMKIDKRTAKFTSEYKGTTYYFCALSCKNEFDANPQKYIGSETTENETQENSETTENSSNTTENKTQEASEQATAVATNSTDSTASTVATENETEEASEQVTPETTNNTDSASSSVVDVICGMTIDKRTAEFKSEYKGTTYYFCALSCKEKFNANPEKYISSETTE